MGMREPAFWWQPGGGRLLAPLGALYGAIASARMAAPGASAGVPVICLGNLTVGGAGKTPAALTVAHLLLEAHARPFFLSRGYGGRLAGPVRVDLSFHHAADVGDEPLLLAGLAPTFVARDRIAGASAARNGGAGVIVMDDGFKILAQKGPRNRSGRWHARHRQRSDHSRRPVARPAEAQLARTHAIVVVGPADNAASITEAARRRGIAIFHARLEPDRGSLAALGRRKVLAFAGIGNPDKFFATLAEAGIAVAERMSFHDHHRYTAAEANH